MNVIWQQSPRLVTFEFPDTDPCAHCPALRYAHCGFTLLPSDHWPILHKLSMNFTPVQRMCVYFVVFPISVKEAL